MNLMRKLFTFVTALLTALAVNAEPIAAGAGTLKAAIAAASDGDVIELAAGEFTESSSISITKNITITAADMAEKPLVKPVSFSIFGADISVKFVGVNIQANGTNDVFDIASATRFELDGCEIYSLGTRCGIKVGGTAHVDAIKINDCYFHDGSLKPVLEVENNTTQHGCNLVEITNSTFANFTSVENALLRINSKGGNFAADASDDQVIKVDHCTFYNFIKKSNDTYGFIDSRKSTKVTITNCIMVNPDVEGAGYAMATQTYGGTVSNCLDYRTKGHRTSCTARLNVDPLFVDAADGDLTLSVESPAMNAGTDGKTLGDPRWWPVITYPETDFEGGYAFTGKDATIDAGILKEDHYGADRVYLRYNGSTPVTSAASWKIQATRACFVDVKVYTADNSWNNANDANYKNGPHNFDVELWNEDAIRRLDTLAEGPYVYKHDGYYTASPVPLGRLLIPAEGLYTIKLKNIRDWAKCGVDSVTFTYVDDPREVYLKPNIWDVENTNEKYAVWCFEGTMADSWSKFMTLVEGEDGIYTTTIPANYTKITFARQNGDLEAPAWGDGKTWNQTVNLDAPTTKKLFTVNEWNVGENKSGGVWSKYNYVPVLEDGYYLVGSFGGEEEWDYADLTAAKKFVVNPSDENEYTITADLAVGDEFKAIYLKDDEYETWYPAGTDNEYVVTDWTAGEKTIYFRPTYSEGWKGHFYIAPNAPVVTYSDFEIDLRDGQLGTDKSNPNNKYLTINGETYTYSDAMPFRYNAYLASAAYNGNQHGYVNLKVTMPVVAGNYMITIGNCQYNSSNGAVKNEDESATLNLIDKNGQTITAIETPKNCYDQNTSENITSVWFVAEEAQTIKIVCPQYTPYIKVEKVESVPQAITVYTVNFVNDTEGATGTVPAQEEVVDGESLTIPLNRTLYKEGYTLIGWSDGIDTYAVGETFTPDDNATLIAVFTENAASLLNAAHEVTVKWEFEEANGAPSLSWEGVEGFLVAQVIVGGARLDVKLTIDASDGKFYNVGRGGNWCQINAGTKLIMPSKKDAVVVLSAMNEPAGSTLDGGTYTYENQKASFTVGETEGSSALVIGSGNQWYRSLQVTYPASVADGMTNTDANVKAQKLMENGQLLIIKNGIRYNAQGIVLR